MFKSISKALLLASCLAAPFGSQAYALTLEPIAKHSANVFDEGAAEIVSYDKAGKKLFVVDGHDKAIDIFDISNPSTIKEAGTLNVTDFGKGANSVDVHGDYVAIAVENKDKQANGKLVLYKTDGTLVGDVELGALPDCVVFAPNGKFVMVANEGEPSDDFKTDPVGTVSIVSIPSLEVKTVGFGDLKAEDFGDDFHTAAPEGISFEQQIEPEYIAITPDSKTAFVSLQESNAIAVIDTETAKLKTTFALGFQDYSKVKADLSDKDGKINRQNWPVLSFRMPDTVKAFAKDGVNYVVMANEGDSRDYDGYSEEERLGKVKLDPIAFPNAKELQKKENLGRLKITTAQGDTDGDGDFDVIYGYGGRSFSIFNETGEMVFDSADEIEAKLAELVPSAFNSQGANESFDNRSDDKGAEPEALELAEIGSKLYAFIGLERMSGIVVYDITDPAKATFVTYASNTKLDGESEKLTAGDIAPEGIKFIAGKDSPNGEPMIAVANEVSGTVTLWAVK
ncbi:LVIVD repeat-containing protein [Cohaesibacter marisflavi]|uniref:LVIVD repeat-containing protein n=1 Tax=Cohaesibacter marisflavi TaxID=655353 RepID=A0A1I5KTT5_9HYPH|nr:choice-of-anchor I family protein [Cohaesibacter marisflavi]SFO88435.1 LVIVD repeat-containing protein [Cohaesibacter marisflavi]